MNSLRERLFAATAGRFAVICIGICLFTVPAAILWAGLKISRNPPFFFQSLHLAWLWRYWPFLFLVAFACAFLMCVVCKAKESENAQRSNREAAPRKSTNIQCSCAVQYPVVPSLGQRDWNRQVDNGSIRPLPVRETSNGQPAQQ